MTGDHGSTDPGDPGAGDRGGRPAHDRDRTTVRRALRAGLIVWAVLAALLGGGLAPGGGRAISAGIMLALIVAAIVVSAWLLVALGLDVHAGHRPSRRRLLWTGGATAFAVISPAFLVALGG